MNAPWVTGAATSLSTQAATSASPGAKGDKDKLDFIDALRGVACLSILAYHLSGFLYTAEVDVPPSLEPLTRFTGYAVPLFFIVSSFTLYLSLEAKEGEAHRFIKFYIRRLFRIAPLFYAMLIVYLLRSVIILRSPPSALEVLANIFFVFNLIPSYVEGIVHTGWTIGAEMLFYLWLPLIFMGVNSLRRSVAFVGLAILLSRLPPILFPNIFEDQYSSFGAMNFFSQLPVFAIGVVCYFAYKCCVPKVHGPYRVGASLFLLIPSFSLFYSLSTYQFFYVVPDEVRRCMSLPCWQALAFSFLLLSLSLSSNGLMVNRVTRFYGKISYSIYLVHYLLLKALIPLYGYIGHSALPLMVSLGLCLFLSILVTTPLAMLTYRYIESPGMRYGKRIIARF